MMTIGLVRQGKPEVLFEDLFSDTWRKPIVANFIHTVAQEQADLLAPLPALSCSVGSMKSDADKRRAATRNKIGTHYMRESNLSMFMHSFADSLMTYGFAVMYAEPDYESQLPLIRTMPSVGTYFENDRFGNTLRLAHCYKETVDKIASMFPELAPLIRTKVDQWGNRTVCSGDEKLEVVQWVDDTQWCLFLPDRGDLVLASYEVLTEKCPVRVAELPNMFGEPIGNYDQLIWVQLARHRMALLGLEAGVKAVGAPLAVPRDVNELAVGPDSVIVTESPEKVRRVSIEVPNSAFALTQTLEQELRLGARYPEGRATGMDASVITGQGVHALMGSFDAQIATAQSIIGNCLARCWSSASRPTPRSGRTPASGRGPGQRRALRRHLHPVQGHRRRLHRRRLLRVRGRPVPERRCRHAATAPWRRSDRPVHGAPEHAVRDRRRGDAALDGRRADRRRDEAGPGRAAGLPGPMAAQGQDPRPTCGPPPRSSRAAATARTWPT
jgi:hypothetical protein